ncbi:MAG: DUF2490 domain-containing protein [Candidatus Marinimicrobia bacterium]|nr:DUF2490 domain-containing protein [Candidatus Neomarinimicrobiota bacterium]
MKKLTIIGLGICFSLFIVMTAFAYEDGDWQFWNTESVEGNLVENWKVKLEEEFRFGDNIGEFYYHHTDGSLTYKLTNWFHLSLSYRQIYENKDEEWKEENRPHVNGTFKWKWQDFEFKNRSRFEYRIREGKENAWRYRNKLTLGFPLKWTKLGIQPYLADEIFIDFDEGDLNRNRLYAGFKAKLMKYLAPDIFYLWQTSEKDGDWIDYKVIGAKLKVEF